MTNFQASFARCSDEVTAWMPLSLATIWYFRSRSTTLSVSGKERSPKDSSMKLADWSTRKLRSSSVGSNHAVLCELKSEVIGPRPCSSGEMTRRSLDSAMRMPAETSISTEPWRMNASLFDIPGKTILIVFTARPLLLLMVLDRDLSSVQSSTTSSSMPSIVAVTFLERLAKVSSGPKIFQSGILPAHTVLCFCGFLSHCTTSIDTSLSSRAERVSGLDVCSLAAGEMGTSAWNVPV
mmetsp:Transcript_18144/g.54560  ORF Transcript_18144/g.54560 Transcript_18144/m.54560 type:complete len:237 (-) Transcript_18144:1950-2660(-)